MTDRPRYAIYFAPEADSPLWRFGSAAIGYDAATGADLPIPAIDGVGADELADFTADPRLYGFHATLKPPFRLADGVTPEALIAAAAEFAARRTPFVIPDLAVSALDAFLALTPISRNEPLHALADACVIDFDPLRAPLDAADRAKRLKSPLSARQIEHLDRWGYPYVFEQFRFHMTLTGRLEADRRDRIQAALAARFRPIAAPVAVDAVTVFEQPGAGRRFRILARLPFAAG